MSFNTAFASSGNNEEKDTESLYIQQKLFELSLIPFENNKHALRCVRRAAISTVCYKIFQNEAEKWTTDVCKDVAAPLEAVRTSVQSIRKDILKLKSRVDGIDSYVAKLKQEHRNCLDMCSQMRHNKKKSTMKQTIARSFVERLYLPLKEVKITNDNDTSIPFLQILDRLQNASIHCVLLQRMGYTPLQHSIEVYSSDLHKRTLKLVHKFAMTAVSCNLPRNNITLKNIMAALQRDSSLFNDILEKYCNTKCMSFSKAFIDALTNSGGSGTPKPIEDHIHDTKRYVGDILAWLHQHVPIEEENLDTILNECNDIDKKEVKQKCLSSITEGICKPLHLRIESVLSSETSLQQLHQTTNLFQYYVVILREAVPNSALESTLNDLTKMSENSYFWLLRETVKRLLLETNTASMTDLSPADGVKIVLKLLTDNLSTSGLIQRQQSDMTKIVRCVLEPLLHVLNLNTSRMTTVDAGVYLLNCFYEIHTALSLYEFMDEWLERIQAEINSQIDAVSSEQASTLVANLNLGPIYNILQIEIKVPLSQISGMDPDNLVIFKDTFDGFLKHPEAYVLPQVYNLACCSHRSTIQRRAYEVILAIYKQLYKSVTELSSGYKNPERILPRRPEEVEKVLISSSQR